MGSLQQQHVGQSCQKMRGVVIRLSAIFTTELVVDKSVRYRASDQSSMGSKWISLVHMLHIIFINTSKKTNGAVNQYLEEI